MDDFIFGIRFLAPQNNLFVVIKSIYDDRNKWDDSLHVVKLKGQEFIGTGWTMHLGKTRLISSDFPLYHTWLVHNKNLLGQVKNMTSLAWTSEPTSYVVSNGELLHKWDLDELPNARVFVMPGDDDEKEKSVFRRIGNLFGGKG
jgi:hypothetical protein